MHLIRDTINHYLYILERSELVNLNDKIIALETELQQVDSELSKHFDYYNKKRKKRMQLLPGERDEYNELIHKRKQLNNKINQYKQKLSH